MKYLFSISLLIGSFFFISSCNEKLDAVGQFKETAVVYGLLDQNNTTHMIKINRAFIGPGNSLEIAQIPDSSYFDNIVVTIDEAGTNRSWTLQDTIITNKDQNGVFYAPEQKLYYFETPTGEELEPGRNYKLKIDVDNGRIVVTGSTQVVDGMTAVSLSSSTSQIKLVENPGEYKTFSLSPKNGTARLMSAEIDVKIRERIGADYTPKHIKWTISEKETAGEITSFSLLGASFFNKIKTACESSDPNVDRRLLDTITFTFTGAAEDLYNYILVNKPSSALTQSKPTFTNLSITDGYEVVGIFSSRQTLVIPKAFYIGNSAFTRSIDSKTTQELCQGPITGTLLFCSDHPGDVAPFPKPYVCN